MTDRQWCSNTMPWLQISPEDVKALDAQWEEVTMRSDVPVTMDDIQEVHAAVVASRIGHGLLTESPSYNSAAYNKNHQMASVLTLLHRDQVP